LLLLVIAPILMALAILLDDQYLFYQHFISELGRSTNENFLSRLLFTLGLIFFGVSLILFYFSTITGQIAGLCFVLVAFAPIDLFPDAHMILAIAAFGFLTITTIQNDQHLLTSILIMFFIIFLLTDSLLLKTADQKFVFGATIFVLAFVDVLKWSQAVRKNDLFRSGGLMTKRLRNKSYNRMGQKLGRK